MANIGKQRPTELLQGHWSKAQLEERKNSELQVEKLKEIPKPPTYLSKEQKAIYKKTCQILIDVNLLTNMDIDIVIRYAIVQDMYIQLTKKINSDPELLLDDKIINKQMRLFKEADTISNLLCLNIIARNKIVVNKEEKEEINKFSKFVRCDDDEK